MEEAVPPKKKIPLGAKLLLVAIVFFIIVILLPKDEGKSISEAESADAINFSQSDYGSDWPLIGVESGKVYCVESAVVFRDDKGGQVYGLNGAATSYARTRGYDWKPIGDVQTVGKDISFMLEPGKKLCSN